MLFRSFDKVEREWRDDGEGLFGGYLEEISREKQAHFITHTIYAYNFVHSEPFDIWIELKIVFFEGEVKSITVHEYKETDSAPRIERQKQWAQQMKKDYEYRQTFRGKIQMTCQSFLRKILRFCSKQIMMVANFLDKIAFQL